MRDEKKELAVTNESNASQPANGEEKSNRVQRFPSFQASRRSTLDHIPGQSQPLSGLNVQKVDPSDEEEEMEDLVEADFSLLPNPIMKKKKKRSKSRRKRALKKKRQTTDIDHLMEAENESPEAVLKEFVESFFQQSRYLQKEFIEKQFKAMKKRLGDGENPLL